MEPNSIIYSLVGFGDKPLAAYSEYKGTFQKTCQNYLHSVEANSSGGYTIDDYCIFYINENGITYLIMTDLKYSKISALSCLESIKKEFLSSFADKDLESLQEFELDKEFKPKLKMKYEYYNENKEVANESTQKLKDEVFKMNDDVSKVLDLLNVRGDKAVEVNKANNLAERSYKYKSAAKKTNEKKKIFYIIGIILILLIIGYIISVFVCHSFVFDYSSD